MINVFCNDFVECNILNLSLFFALSFVWHSPYALSHWIVVEINTEKMDQSLDPFHPKIWQIFEKHSTWIEVN